MRLGLLGSWNRQGEVAFVPHTTQIDYDDGCGSLAASNDSSGSSKRLAA
jgi:hypothetical protein